MQLKHPVELQVGTPRNDVKTNLHTSPMVKQVF